MTMGQVIALAISATSLFFLLVLWIALGVANIKEKRKRQREYYVEQLMKISKRLDDIEYTQLDGIRDVSLTLNEMIFEIRNDVEELKNAKKKSNR